MIVTFFGHRDYLSTTDDEEKLAAILESFSDKGEITFYLGGYGRFDAFASRCAKTYKKKHPDAKIIFISPYLGDWLKKRLAFMKIEYDDTIYPGLENVPLKFAIEKRNQWMIDKSDFVICFVKTGFGGAYNSLVYAKRKNKPFINLYQDKYPPDLSVKGEEDFILNKECKSIGTAWEEEAVGPHNSRVT